MQDVQLYISQGQIEGTVTQVTATVLVNDTNANFLSEYEGNVMVDLDTNERTTIQEVQTPTRLRVSPQIFSTGSRYAIIQKTQRAELFEDEKISLTQKIKDIKDVSKIFTDFSKDFTIPASRTNNKLLKHFYESSIVDGFDARFLIDASIKLNGVDFRKGKIRLLGVNMTDNNPSSYKISFVGETVSLKSLMGDDELTDLPYLDAFNHNYSYSNIKAYMQDGFHLDPSQPDTQSPDMMYPFISCKSRYYIDTKESQPEIDNVRNIYSSDNTDKNDFDSISYVDLKPAIKVEHILTAIENKYGLTFSQDFFFSDEIFDQLYMWCNREAGTLSELVEETSETILFEDLYYTHGDADVRMGSDNSYFVIANTADYYRSLKYEGTIDVSGVLGISYDFKLYDKEKGTVLIEEKNLTGDYNFSYERGEYEDNWRFNFSQKIRPTIEITTTGGLSQFNVTNIKLSSIIDAHNSFANDSTTVGNYDDVSVTSLSNGVDFRTKLLPKLKVLDFLTGLFKMFNLIAYFEDDTTVVKTLDDFYLHSNHNTYNIDKYVDISKSKVERSDIFSEINYEFKKPKTIFALESNEAENDEYGNERFKSGGENTFDGGKYDVKVAFGHMMYENIVDQNTSPSTSNPTGILWGYSVNKDESPIIDDASLFIAKKSGVISSREYYVTNKPVGEDGLGYDKDLISHLYLPSNNYTDISLKHHSINFGSEYDARTNLTQNNSLFTDYHDNFITNIYQTQARIVKITAHLPLSILLKYKLNDRFIFRGKKYLINNFDVNLQSGETKLELLTDNYG